MEGAVSTASVTPETSASEAAQETSIQEQDHSNGQDNGAQAQAGKQASTAKALKELSEQDMDALVTVKVNGEVKKLPVKEVLRLSQLEQASHAKMQEAAHVKKQAQAMLQLAKQDPKAFMKHLGMDPYEFAEMTLAERLEYMQMSPEQRELQELKREKEERLAREQEDQEREAKDKADKETLHQEESLSKEIAQAFGEVGLPRSKLYFEQITAMMLWADKQGKQLSAREAASKIKQRFHSNLTEHIQSMDAQAIRELLGDKKWDEMRENDLKRLSGTPPTVNSGGGPAKRAASPAKRVKKEMTPEEYDAYIQKLKSGA